MTDAVASLLSARTTFAFIIAAIDRPGPALQQAFAESRGTLWRLFFVFFLIFVPPVFVYFVASFAAAISIAAQTFGQTPATPDGFENWAMNLFLSPPIILAGVVVWIAIMLSYVALAAGAARAYQIRVEHGLTGVAEVFS